MRISFADGKRQEERRSLSPPFSPSFLAPYGGNGFGHIGEFHARHLGLPPGLPGHCVELFQRGRLDLLQEDSVIMHENTCKTVPCLEAHLITDRFGNYVFGPEDILVVASTDMASPFQRYLTCKDPVTPGTCRKGRSWRGWPPSELPPVGRPHQGPPFLSPPSPLPLPPSLKRQPVADATDLLGRKLHAGKLSTARSGGRSNASSCRQSVGGDRPPPQREAADAQSAPGPTSRPPCPATRPGRGPASGRRCRCRTRSPEPARDIGTHLISMR